jgi:hypothetical protein
VPVVHTLVESAVQQQGVNGRDDVVVVVPRTKVPHQFGGYIDADDDNNDDAGAGYR